MSRIPSPLAAGLLALALAPSLARAEIPDLPVESYRLPNGLRVVLSPDPSVPRVTVCVAYHVGSKDERPGRTGFAHFFEHMMFRGTEHVPNYDVPLQEAGSGANAFTSEDMTVYFEAVPSRYLERALYLEAERLGFLPSALDQEKFDTEREVVKNERRQSYENRPYGLASETIAANLYPEGHPYSWSVIGSMRDLDAATIDDLKAFFAEYYHPGNAVLCLVGDLDPERVKPMIARYFGPLPAGAEPSRPEVPESPAVEGRLTLKDRVQLPRLYLSWPTVADTDPDDPALELLADLLAGGETSRLHKALVLEQIATDVRAGQDGKEVAGDFQVVATAAPGRAVEEVEEIIREEIGRLRDESPTSEELDRVRADLELGAYLALVSPLGRAIALSVSTAQRDDPLAFLRDFEQYDEVTPGDIRRVAGEYLTPEALALVVEPVGPGEEESGPTLAGPTDDRASATVDDRPEPAGDVDWSAMPGPSEVRGFETPEVIRRTLSNGVEVWISPWGTLPIVEVAMLLPFGTADDPSGQSGLANLTATLLDQGTADLTATELAERFQALGVRPTVGAGTESTTIRFDSLAGNLRPALDLVGHMLAEPRLDPSDVERERRLQLADLERGPDSPYWIASRAFDILLFGADHPLGNPSDGYPETVEGLTGDDLRAFHDQFVVPGGTRLVVVGDVEADALVEDLEGAFGDWDGEAPDRPSPPPATEPGEAGVVYLVDKPGAAQTLISVGRRWRGRDDPRYISTLLGNRILGGDFLSRLNQNLRERNGFTYGARSAFRFLTDRSTWSVSTAVRTDVTAPALREVINELDALAGDKPFTTEEFTTARGAEVQAYPRRFESPSNIAAALVELARLGLPTEELATLLDRLEGAEEAAVREATATLVDPDERVILVVGDREAIGPALEGAGFGEIRAIDFDGEPVD